MYVQMCTSDPCVTLVPARQVACHDVNGVSMYAGVCVFVTYVGVCCVAGVWYGSLVP